MTYNAEVTATENGAGKIAFVQTVQGWNAHRKEATGELRVKDYSDSPVLDSYDTDPLYDTPEPIGSSETKTCSSNDSPANPILDSDNWTGMHHNFKTYLVYKPAGDDSIWVTLAVLDWHVYGSATDATRDAGQDTSGDTSGYSSSVQPTWTRRVQTIEGW